MSHSPTLPTLLFYAREGCELCEESRDILQAALEARVIRGEPIARVREVDIAADPELTARYGDLIPVIATNGTELPLAMGRRAIDGFLDRVLPQLA
ncbi:MAG TPA: glutaredoxin family protein [Candidatus Limnocylindria bacterium]|nr:glutaredoxin family protein [Candidatus Limnocylindria bacterium]